MRETIELRDGWTLYRNGSEVGEGVSIPHDAMLGEPRSADAVTGNAGAYFPGGTYRYELALDVPASWAGKVVTAEFEGVYQKATVLVDGKELARNAYGYTGFFVNLTEALTPGTQATLTVIADNAHQPNSRWYSGSGIYRPVRLHVQEQDHIALDGVRVSTLALSPARVRVTTEVMGDGAVEVSIMRDGTTLSSGTGADVELDVADAQLWSADEPNLYECVARLVKDGSVVDEQRVPFGIRTVEWGSFGLRVNGEDTLLRGGCIHHDHGILGAAEHEEAAWRRVAILKQHGFNAIRSSHNPLSKTMLAACDRLGMYVIDEFADMWYEHKNPADYATDFLTHWESDLTAMVTKDLNHPSVIMYSIGNENAEPRDERGVACAQMLAERVRALDPTQPVTAGVNPTILFAASLGIDSFNGDGEEGAQASNADGGMSGNSSLVYNTYVAKMGDVMSAIARTHAVGRAVAPYLDVLDAVGYNYASGRYRQDVRRNPDRPVFGSETMPYDIARNWHLVKDMPQVFGDFMWTAWDYLGECSLAGWSNDPEPVNKPFPWLCADTGALDLIGDPNGECALAEAVWGVSDPLLFVRPLTLPDPIRAPWRGTNSIPSWSWRGCEGERATVEVYTRAPIVKLYLNGRHLATKRVRGCHADFSVRYEPGTLVAVACQSNGEAIGRVTLSSASAAVGLCLKREESYVPGGSDIVFVDVLATDYTDVVEASVDAEVTITVEGGELLAFGSAAQKSEHSYLEGTFPLRYGRGLAVVRVGEEPCRLRAEADGLISGEIAL